MHWVRDGGALIRRLMIALGVTLVGGSLLIAVTQGGGVVLTSGSCTVTVGATEAKVSSVQAENAATIVAISVQRGLPLRAATIALATAIQESKLVNVEHGDRDSLGLFQQRPSQGWGTAEQILDPVYSTNAFYDALARVPGWRKMSLTEAAQAVQRSAFPEAYATHEEAAQALASALSGRSPRALTCTVRGAPSGDDARAVLARMETDITTGFGDVVSVSRNGDVLVVRTARGKPRPRSWAVATYLIARAGLLDVDRVAVGNRVWERDSGSWRSASPPEAGTVTATPA